MRLSTVIHLLEVSGTTNFINITFKAILTHLYSIPSNIIYLSKFIFSPAHSFYKSISLANPQYSLPAESLYKLGFGIRKLLDL